MPHFLAFDSETGSLDPKSGDMLTLYLAIFDQSLKLIEELDLKLKPDNGRLPIAGAEALAINKIDIKKHLEDPETITYSETNKKVVAMLKRYCTGKKSRVIPLGHNVDFDIKFLQEYVLLFDEYEKYIHYGKRDTKMIVDFLKDSQWLPPELGNLGSITKHFEINLEKAHTAKADTLACVEVYKKLLELMASRKNAGQSLDIISLLEQE